MYIVHVQVDTFNPGQNIEQLTLFLHEYKLSLQRQKHTFFLRTISTSTFFP